MTKYRIIAENRSLNYLDDLLYFKVQKRVWIFFWKDLRMDSPFFEFETLSAECAKRTLLHYIKEERELRAIKARDKDLKSK